jgi:hypothetical protein
MLCLGVTDCGYYALSAWLRLFRDFCAVQLAPAFVSHVGHLSEGIPEGSMTRCLPVAIAGDHAVLERKGTEYAFEMAVELLKWAGNNTQRPEA